MMKSTGCFFFIFNRTLGDGNVYFKEEFCNSNLLVKSINKKNLMKTRTTKISPWCVLLCLCQ